MNKTIHEGILQGSKDWHELRARHFTASEAPSMMGASKYLSRLELIKQKATGIAQEIDAAKQRLFDAGHEAEAAARPLIEAQICEDLYPVTVSVEIDGLPLLASMDGLTMDESTGWECKLYNKSLEAQILNEDIDPHYYWQLEQQALVSGCEKIIFTTSDGTPEHTVSFTYTSKPDRRAQLIAGWKQFAADLAEYVPQEAAPEVIAAPVAGFGALVMQVEGRVVACNLDAFQAGAQAFLDRLPKAAELQSDQDFADAESAVKACSEAESRIQAALDSAMAQAASIDEVFRAARHVSELIRSARLALDRSVKSRKESIRMEIMQDAQAKLAEHVKALNERIGWHNGSPIISPAAADFATAIKGKKTVASLRDACDTELARAKIAASEIADRIEANRKAMGDHAALFPDFTHVCTKTPEDFANLVAVRVQQQKEAEARRAEQERIEAERKAQAEQNAAQQAAQAAQAPSGGQPQEPAVAAPVAAIQQRPQPVADDGARMKLGDINARLHPLAVTADMLSALGFQPAGNQGAAKLYKAGDFPLICDAIVRHVQSASTNQLRKAA